MYVSLLAYIALLIKQEENGRKTRGNMTFRDSISLYSLTGIVNKSLSPVFISLEAGCSKGKNENNKTI